VATIENSTIADNSAGYAGGGIYNYGGLYLESSTVSGNTETGGGGGGGISNGGNTYLEADILATPTGPPSGGECSGAAVGDYGYNIDDDGSCGFTHSSVSSSPAIDAYLGSLSDNGGPTQTVPLLASSTVNPSPGPDPALGAIPSSLILLTGGSACSNPDQRGIARTAPCDVGAFELVPIGTVGFNSDGGAAVASLSGPDGSSITLPSDTQPRYTFDGWFTQASGGTEVGGAGASYTVPAGGITLYAQWTAIATPPPPPSPPTPPTPPPPPPHGYWLVGSDGGIFSFGAAQFHGSTGSLHLQRPVVGIVPTADHGGYWLDASDGGVFSFGDTQFYGSIPGLGLHPAGSGLPNSLNAPIVGMVPSIDDGGYFMVASDGGVFAFGDAHFAGSCPGIGGCSGAAVAVMPDSSGNGYWLVTQTGNVYTFGDASYYGAPRNTGSPVTSAVRTPDGGGYWILTADGTVYNYGNAGNYGDTPRSWSGYSEFDPATAIFTTSDGDGYWVASAAGAVNQFGDAPWDGGMSGTGLNGSIIAATGF
jgi:uncharacterized repeat protein (TIGR02543 family)